MLLKFNRKGDNDPTVYVMSAKNSAGEVRSCPPKVIRGSIDRFRSEHHLVHRRQKDTRVVLSYHVDDDPTPAEIVLDVDLLDRVVYPGFRYEDIEEVFVLHQQARSPSKRVRCDVHGIWLRQHMGTGLAHNPYYARRDFERFDLLKRILNLARGYAEPASAEHSRVFGHTAEGARAHGLAEVVRQICDESPISSRKQLADELDRRGYKVKRRRSMEPRGRKSLTVTMPDGADAKLVGDPFTPVKVHTRPGSDKTVQEQLDSMLEELNALCLARARRNWLRYQSKIQAMTLGEAEKNGYGFEPITIQQLFALKDYENKKRRSGFLSRTGSARIKD